MSQTVHERLAERIERLAPHIIDHCRRLYAERLSAVFVFGSYATGRANDESDLDLLVVVDSSSEPRRHRAVSFGEPESSDDIIISPIVFTAEEVERLPSFLLTLADGYRTLYSRADDAERIVSRIHRWVQESGIEKVPHKGGYYWRGL